MTKKKEGREEKGRQGKGREGKGKRKEKRISALIRVSDSRSQA
jgi:hypothetical protein